MIEFVSALVIVVVVILLFVGVRKPRLEGPRQISPEQTMVFKSDSTDVVSESYYPGIRGSVGPFPIGTREERKKTETFQSRH